MQKVVPEDSVLIPEQATKAFEGNLFTVYQWPQKMYDGSEHTFEMLKRPDTVNVICVVDGKILLITDEQPHFGARKSFPGGRVETSDSTIIAAAQREILEETGYSFNKWKLIKVWQPYPKLEWFIHLVVAWDQSDKQDPTPDAGEKITTELLDFDAVKQLARDRVDYLGETVEVIDKLSGLEDLLALPEFTGRSVDR